MNKDKEGMGALRDYLFGEKPNYVMAALKLQEMIRDHSSIFSHDCPDSIIIAAKHLSNEAKSLLDKLKESKSPKESDLASLRDKMANYKRKEREYNKKYEEPYYRGYDGHEWGSGPS